MKSKIMSNIIIGVTGIIIVIILCVVMYKISQTNIFDTSGGYIKEMASDKDVLNFMEVAEAVSYYELINGKVEDYKDTPIKYYGYITHKEVKRDKTAEYQMIIVTNKKDSMKLGKEYESTNDGLKLAPVYFHTTEAYNNFELGDYIWMYGTLEEYQESDIYSMIPYMSAKKLVLDTE